MAKNVIFLEKNFEFHRERITDKEPDQPTHSFSFFLVNYFSDKNYTSLDSLYVFVL